MDMKIWTYGYGWLWIWELTDMGVCGYGSGQIFYNYF